MILIAGTGLIPAFFVGLIIGPISDKIGRKLALFIQTCGCLVKCIGCLLISYFQWPIWVYSIASFVEGFSGAMPLFYAACTAYTADNTNKGQRSFWVVMVDLFMSFSAVFGNLVSRYIISGLGYMSCHRDGGGSQGGTRHSMPPARRRGDDQLIPPLRGDGGARAITA